MERMRFVVDTMLGDVARWLRLLGYDTVYSRELKDWEILNIAEEEGRVIVTRDVGLYRKASKKGLACVLLENGPIPVKLAKLAALTNIKLEVDIERTRCPACNGVLMRVSKADVKGLVDEAIRRAYDTFWICTRCKKVYWMGSHWNSIRRALEEAKRRVEAYG